MNDLLDKITSKSPHLSWINNNTVYLTLHGSKAYGTNVESSDDDYKGICIPTKEYFLGSQHRFEQAELHEPDAVIYDIRKFFNLAAASNPNIVEALYTDPSDHILVDPIGEIILDNRDKFLSKRVKHTFSGYAVSQLKRIKLHRRYLLNPPKVYPTRVAFGLPEHTLIPQDHLLAAEAEIRKELERFNFDYMDECSEAMKISIRNTMSEMLAEMKLNADDQWRGAARKIGVDDNFIELMQMERAYKNARTEWDNYENWKKNRNPKRAADEAKWHVDLKYAYHLIRLLRMAREILETGKVLVKRPDREELLAIRNGAWSYEQIVEFAEKEDKALQEIYMTSTILPKVPDQKYIDNLCIQLVEKSLSRYSWYNVKKYLKGIL
jgi:predicted nucleotidyltransferase